MRNNVIVFLLLIMLFSLPSCYQDDSQLSQSENIDWAAETVASIAIGNRLCDVMGFPNQNDPPKFDWTNITGTNDIETDYDNFSITLDSNQFECNSSIRIHIKNNNNKPYAFYPIPYIEKFDPKNQSWERLIYAPDEVYYASSWHTGIDIVTLYFNPYYVSTPLEPGEYRFIIFLGNNQFFSPHFNIEE